MASCLFLVLIASFITNWGLQKDIGEISQLRINFQNIQSNEIKNHEFMDKLNPGFQIQVDISSKIPKPTENFLGIDNIVPIAEEGWLEDVADTEQGYILIEWSSLDPIPLCIQQGTWLGSLWVEVCGGYEPYQGIDPVPVQEVEIWQKGEYQGLAHLEWTYDHHETCYKDFWTAQIFADEYIELDSNQYPDVVGDDFWLQNICPDWYGTISGKMVDFAFTMDWTGCHAFTEQGFTIISVREKLFNSQ